MAAGPRQIVSCILLALPGATLHVPIDLEARHLEGVDDGWIDALAWIAAVSRGEVSRAYPFMGLVVGVVLARSGVVLGEPAPWNRWFGVAIVCLGLVVASR